ncbi:MAG: lasso RiPP family leader peptide-containing protein [Mesorhizobium sp.]
MENPNMKKTYESPVLVKKGNLKAITAGTSKTPG